MFRKLLLAASALAVAALVLVMFVSCASADVIYDEEYSFEGNKTKPYLMGSTYNGHPTTGFTVTNVYVEDIETFEMAGLQLTVQFPESYMQKYPEDFWGNPIHNMYAEDVNVTCDSVVRGTCTHGYTVGGDVVYYHVFFDQNCDFDGLSGNKLISFDVIHTDFKPGMANKPSTTGDDWIYSGMLGPSEMGIGSSYTSYRKLILQDYGTTDIVRYSISNWCDFRNDFSIDAKTAYYEMTINRTPSGFSGDTESGWLIWSGDFEYINQSAGYEDETQIVYVFPPFTDFCEEINIHIETPLGVELDRSIEGICDIPDPELFNLQGYTRSVEGNLIPAVLLSFAGDSQYSSEIGYYAFENVETGSYTLTGNKSGYFNTTDSLAILQGGMCWHDVYMIPLDSLEEGEFGGVVYDYCTHQSIQGAYVYLFNETADSGSYAYSNKYGFYRFAGMAENLSYEVSASKDGYDASIVHSFTFNESNVNETHYKTKTIWLLPEDGCPEDGGIPTPPPAPTPPPHEWTNEEIVSWLRVNLMGLFIIVLFVTFMWFLRKAGGSKR